MDTGRVLFDEYRLGGYQRVVSARDNAESEGHFLDFKDFTKCVDPKFRQSHSLEKTFAKIACAFANEGGGLIVWGVESKDDKAARLVPIRDLSNALRRINSMAGQIAVRPIPGVVSEKLLADGAVDEGFIVTYVPESEDNLHQNAFDHRYYFRSGSTTNVMSHSMVEARILAKGRPRIALKVAKPVMSRDASTPSLSPNGWLIKIKAVNSGKTSARSVHIIISSKDVHITDFRPLIGADANYIHSLETREGRGYHLAFSENVRLYGGDTELGLVQIRTEMISPNEPRDFEIVLRLDADNYSALYNIPFTGADLQNWGFHDDHGPGTPYQGFTLLRSVEPT